MAQRQGSVGDGSDIVYRMLDTLTNRYTPDAKKLAILQRCVAELEPFIVGDGYRANYLRELRAQIQRTIATLQ